MGSTGTRYAAGVKDEAVRLRKLGWSLKRISNHLGAALSTVSQWLRDHPLPEKKRRENRLEALAAAVERKKQVRAELKVAGQSELYARFGSSRLTREQKGRAGEAAVLLRLALLGFDVYTANFEGSRVDFLVNRPGSSEVLKLQVKWVRRGKVGSPFITFERSNGRKRQARLGVAEMDVLVGYDFMTDTAYVFLYDELVGLSRTIIVSAEAEEAWDKL